jgi:hypothetical protein
MRSGLKAEEPALKRVDFEEFLSEIQRQVEDAAGDENVLHRADVARAQEHQGQAQCQGGKVEADHEHDYLWLLSIEPAASEIRMDETRASRQSSSPSMGGDPFGRSLLMQ